MDMIRKILVVDDSATARHYLTGMLAERGYEVVTAADGEQAITMSKSETPDLILMDVVMPVLSGFHATRRITRDEDTKHIPVVLVTSKDQEADRIWGMRQGATDYITKPIEAETLFVTIDAIASALYAAKHPT